MHSSIGRSDDLRLLRLCHMMIILMDCINPCPFWVIAGVLTRGKTQEVSTAVRAQICVQRGATVHCGVLP